MAVSKFRRRETTYNCRCCKKLTRNTGDEGSCTLCYECFELAGLENHLSDNGVESFGENYGDDARRLLKSRPELEKHFPEVVEALKSLDDSDVIERLAHALATKGVWASSKSSVEAVVWEKAKVEPAKISSKQFEKASQLARQNWEAWRAGATKPEPVVESPKPIQVAARAPVAPKPTTPREPKKSFEIFGYPVSAVIRWMGKSGWDFASARKALDRLNVPCKDGTIATYLNAGKRGQRGEPAKLSREQVSALNDNAK